MSAEAVANAYDHYMNGLECGVASDEVNERYEAYIALSNNEYPLMQTNTLTKEEYRIAQLEADLGRRKNRIDALATRATRLEMAVARLQGLAINQQERLAKLEAMHHTHESNEDSISAEELLGIITHEATGTGHYASGVEE